LFACFIDLAAVHTDPGKTGTTSHPLRYRICGN
jgi:hypothetical protein